METPTTSDAAVTDLCERLLREVPNTVNGRGTGLPDKLVNPDGPEAAAAIKALEAERDALREALKPFANNVEYVDWLEADDESDVDRPPFKAGDYRRARAALDPLPSRECPSCGGLNLGCPDGCGRDPATGELNGTTFSPSKGAGS